MSCKLDEFLCVYLFIFAFSFIFNVINTVPLPFDIMAFQIKIGRRDSFFFTSVVWNFWLWIHIFGFRYLFDLAFLECPPKCEIHFKCALTCEQFQTNQNKHDERHFKQTPSHEDTDKKWHGLSNKWTYVYCATCLLTLNPIWLYEQWYTIFRFGALNKIHLILFHFAGDFFWCVWRRKECLFLQVNNSRYEFKMNDF